MGNLKWNSWRGNSKFKFKSLQFTNSSCNTWKSSFQLKYTFKFKSFPKHKKNANKIETKTWKILLYSSFSSSRILFYIFLHLPFIHFHFPLQLKLFAYFWWWKRKLYCKYNYNNKQFKFNWIFK